MAIWTKEQTEAIEKSGSNIIVSAGAGSGKTAVLSQRVINKIDNGIHINELLILTFTKAAASEMKNRIRNKLLENDKYKEELNLINSAYITTFDSFALSIVKKYHYVLNIPKDISITDESIITIEESKIIDKIFDEYYSIENESFRNLINKYCIKDDNSLKKIILKIANNIDKLISRDDFINYIKNKYFSESNLDSIVLEFKKHTNSRKEYIRDLLDDIKCYVPSEYYDKFSLDVYGYLDLSVDELKLHTSIKLPNLPRNLNEEAKNIKLEIKSTLDEILELSKYGNEENIKNDILSNKDIVLTIIDIVEKYINELENYKKENQLYTFKDIAFNAIKIVKENEEIRNELKNSFKEIMIDEYQDTNDIQDTFMSLIENNNIYMVGDIKQSIYRFNGSNPSIFKSKYDSYSNNINGIKIDLLKNFRSREEVLINVNEIFELLMDNNIGGAEYRETHKMIYGNKTYDTERLKDFSYDMNILEYEKNDNFTNTEIEVFTIAKDIKNKIDSKIKVFDKKINSLRDVNYSDFVIILDRSKYFNDYKKVFEYLGIPLTILKEEDLTDSTDISLIRNIIDFIIRINNNDFGVEFKYDFTSIARSFLFEIDDNNIFKYFNNNNFKDSEIYKIFSKIDSINSKTSSELLEEILDITDFYNKIYKIGDYENTNFRINNIYNIANSLNELQYSIEEFKVYLDNIIENGIKIKCESYNSNSSSVKIMTIHKSKGLEYPFCYFSDLDHSFNDRDLKEKFIVDKRYGLIVPSNLDSTNNSILKILYTDDYYKEEISEKIRLFYVALTRARENIIIVLPKKDTNKLRLNINGTINDINRLKIRKLSDMIYYIKDYLFKYFSDVDINNIDISKDYLFIKKYINKEVDSNEKLVVNEINIPYEEIEEKHFSKESNKLLSKDSLKNMEFGTKAHEILELIDFKNYDSSVIEDEFIRNKVTKFLDNDLLQNINDCNIYHEYEFIDIVDDIKYHGIIDLMIVHDDYIDIIDFKLKNVLDDNYKKQLYGYKNYIEKITNKVVNVHLYSIIDEKMTSL